MWELVEQFEIKVLMLFNKYLVEKLECIFVQKQLI